MELQLKEKLRMLGISESCRGVMYIQKVVKREMCIEDLNDDQIALVVDAWDSRKFIPEKQYKELSKTAENVVKSEQLSTETIEEYYRRIAINVINFFR